MKPCATGRGRQPPRHRAPSPSAVGGERDETRETRRDADIMETEIHADSSVRAVQRLAAQLNETGCERGSGGTGRRGDGKASWRRLTWRMIWSTSVILAAFGPAGALRVCSSPSPLEVSAIPVLPRAIANVVWKPGAGGTRCTMTSAALSILRLVLDATDMRRDADYPGRRAGISKLVRFLIL